ncbi:hypothetical protein Pcinc_000102 [Petrolisthes cinctipes]|uniref:Uncharacterized protein n=1 Tax=Petrolisthes cinctipes TaxID=88211 RepID=A0AAE1GQ49_PETCI|nr:hypothetical protein Pcinc_000102 [Petrolisthes cinctipes]
MGKDRVSNVSKCESSAQLPQFPFPQVTTEKVYKAAAELAFVPATDSYTSSYTAAPSSYHLLSLPSVEDRGAETLVKPLLNRWNKKATSSSNLIPLVHLLLVFQCLSSLTLKIVGTTGESFYLLPLYQTLLEFMPFLFLVRNW